MALISKIRKHSWIIVASLALALLSFLIMDVVSNNAFGGQTQFTVGKVNGVAIDYNDFSRTEQILYNNSAVDPYTRRTYLWNYFVEKILMEKTAAKLGIGISPTELEELQFGNNLSPVIQQRFLDPNTNTVDRDQLNQIKQGLENNTMRADLVTFWNEQKTEIIKERIQAKYSGLVSKAIYSPTWMAEQRHIDATELVDFQYVKLPFDLITDSISVTDKEIEKYIDDHKVGYTYPEEARFLEYVNFPVIPTAEDSAAIQTELNVLVDSFRNTKEDSLFVTLNGGQMDPAFYKKDQLSLEFAEQLYALPKGGLLGPYIDNGLYRLAKMVHRKVVADSVDVRHILRSVQTIDQLASAQATIDSLKNLLESGAARFDSLAIRYSQDGSGFTGGELGMTGHDQMVKPFNDVIFFQAEPGKYYTVTTQFGIHLIEVKKQVFGKNPEDRVQLAYIDRPVVPSQVTQDRVEDEVTAINNTNRTLDELRKTLASRPELSFEKTGALRKNDNTAGLLPTGESTRSMIRWAFDKKASPGDVSPEIFLYEDAVNFVTNQITIAGLRSIQPKGLASVEAVREDVTLTLTNKKKAERLISEIGNTTDIYALATKYNVKVDTATRVNFTTSFLQQMGNEPKVIAAAFGTEQNATSKPIVGNGGVYVVKTTGRAPSIGEPDIAFFREQVSSVSRNNVTSFLMESLKKSAKIKDNRFTFF